MKHGLLHILGCIVPISLIFILPALGVSSGVTYTVFIALMFACHFFMMGGHSRGAHDQGSESELNEVKLPRKGDE